MELDTIKANGNQSAPSQAYQQQQQARAVQEAAANEQKIAKAPVKRAARVGSAPQRTPTPMPRVSNRSRADYASAVRTSGKADIGADAVTGSETEGIDIKPDRSSSDVLDRAIEQINTKLMEYKNEFQYSFHKQTGTISIRIFDSETKELLREIPPIKRLDAIAKMWELAGIIVDERG